MKKVLILVWLVVAVVLNSAATATTTTKHETKEFRIPRINWRPALGETELAYLRFALESNGIVALTGITGFREARLECLLALGKCHQEGKINQEQTLAVTLQDGTRRVTIATNKASKAEDYGCAGLDVSMRKLQTLVDEASLVFAKALDDSVTTKREGPLFMATNNPELVSYDDFSSIVKHGDHLDHLHVYEKSSMSNDQDDDATLAKHVDQGLFIAIVPSISIKDGSVINVNDGFEIELLSTGQLSRVVIPDDGDAVVFMMGDGMKNWVNKHNLRAQMNGVPHRLVMQGGTGISRVWFGRMFFPPADAFISKQQAPFAKLRMTSVESAVTGVDFTGCSSKFHVLRDLTETACGANEIYCWMACRSTAGLSCGSGQAIECVNQEDGNIWTQETEHCFTCAAACYPGQVSNASTSPICNTNVYPTNMYMDGFNGVGGNIPCLIFLFTPWVMDTQAKYAFGSIGAFFIGVFIEFLILLRRQTKLPKKTRTNYWMKVVLPDYRQHPRLQLFVLICLYGVQLVFAYFLMLLAMSFAAIIFSMSMLGLIVGHFLLNPETPAGGNEACCSANDDLLRQSDVVTSPEPLLAADNCCSGQTNPSNNGNCCGAESGSSSQSSQNERPTMV